MSSPEVRFLPVESPPHDALYDSWFTSESQLRLLDLDGYVDAYLTQLRLDLLFFRKVVIPDTAIIDGWFFGQTEPTTILEWCGRGVAPRRLPIEIRCRETSFEASLASFLRRDDRDSLNDYPLQMLRDREAREAIREGLRQTSTSVLDQALRRANSVPQAIGGLLSSVLAAEGISNHTVEQFAEVWEGWVKAERDGLVVAIPWRAPLNVEEALAADALSPPSDLLTERGRDAYAEITSLLQRRRFNKSDALNILLGDHDLSWHDDDFAWDYNTIVDWYDRGRARAIARQNEAAFGYDAVPLFPDHPLEHFRGLARAPDGLSPSDEFLVTLPSDFRSALATLSPLDYRRLFATHGSLISDFWNSPSPARARQVAEAAYDAATTAGLRPRPSAGARSMWIFGKLAGAVAAAQVAGAWAGIGFVLASEAAQNASGAIRERNSTRGVVEYLSRRLS